MDNLTNSIDQVVQENVLPHEWSKEVLAELKNLEVKNTKRDDLRKIPFVTIDGKDAKDFDDAVFCEFNKDGFNLQVAIADVAEIVKQDSSIDKEALLRGTSIYFPKRVIPMLPEEISNNLCSLIPSEDRNVLVCKINYNKEGEINSYEFSEAVINSHKRFTYKEVEFIKQNKDINLSAEILRSLDALEKLTKKLLYNRSKRYALEIESSEPTLSFGSEGNISKILVPKRLFAHQMIEEAMISANICAAKFIKKYFGFGVYRIHEEPESLKLENLKRFFSLKGLSTKSFSDSIHYPRFAPVVLSTFLFIQLIIPFRYSLYPGELFWNEQGYRFSWRVMLMEKRGDTTFKIKDSVSGKFFYVKNEEFLTPFQEKQMSFQPDFILEYAHYLGDYFNKNGYNDVEVYAESYVTLNGRTSKVFVDPNIDLMKEKRGFSNKKWITKLEDEIKGF